MRFIVTGAPRSATKYAARLLMALGVPCSHECHLRPTAPVADCLRWWRAAAGGESSWMAWTLLSLFPEPVPVLHTRRDPWQVIDSLANRNSILKFDQLCTTTMQGVRDTIATYAPRVLEWESVVDRAAAFVVTWNRLIEENVPPPMRLDYSVERLSPGRVHSLLRHIGAEASSERVAAALAELRTDVNAGYRITDTPGISDPVISEYVAELANGRPVITRQFDSGPQRQTREELAAAMSPELVTRVNAYAMQHGYDQAVSCAA